MTTVKLVLDGQDYYFEFPNGVSIDQINAALETIGGRPRRK